MQKQQKDIKLNLSLSENTSANLTRGMIKILIKGEEEQQKTA